MKMDSYQLKWHSHANHLNGSVAALLRSERFTDVVLCTLDGCQIPAHKFILNSCSIYLSNLFESQRTSQRLGNSVVYVILPPEISTKALQILIEYMYKGETTVSNDVLDIVLKAGDLLKVRGLWRQNDDKNESPADKIINEKTLETVNKPQTSTVQNADPTEVHKPKITVKKDEKLLKTYAPIQHLNISRQSFIGPPKLVFIKTSDSNQTLRALTTKSIVPQTIIVNSEVQAVPDKPTIKELPSTNTTVENETNTKKIEKKYIKRPRLETKKLPSNETTETKEEEELQKNSEKEVTEETSKVSEEQDSIENVDVKTEPIWDDPEEQAKMLHSEIDIKNEIDELADEALIEEEVYSPLTCELCFEVFHIPADWVRHIRTHAESALNSTARRRKTRSSSDDTEETTALLRCDLCQKHFPNPAEWVRHIQSIHTETELARSNNSAPPRRHNRYVFGNQKKTCDHCKKTFPSHASMVIHLRTHTGERPFVCGLCNKGFNVKSNLLRHLRTLHDTIVSPGNVPLLQEDVLLSPVSPGAPVASTSSEQEKNDPS